MTRSLILSGAVVILAASLLYASLPPELVLPMAQPDNPATWPGTNMARLKLAGMLGLLGDALLIVGALRASRTSEPWFWRGTALATLIFVGFDAITSIFLDPANPEALPILRSTMSQLFVFGVATFALAALFSTTWRRISKTGGAITLAAACL